MSRISTDTSSVYLDFAIAAKSYLPAVISFYDRSLQSVKGFSASLNISMHDISVSGADKNLMLRRMNDHTFSTFIQPIVNGKEKFYHAIAINNSMNDNLLLLQRGREGEIFYNYLMQKFDYPLLKEWGTAMYEWAYDNSYIDTDNILCRGTDSLVSTLPVMGGDVPLSDIYAAAVYLDDERIINCIQELFDMGKIWISQNRQNPLVFTNTDEYLKAYGHTLVKNLSDLLSPLRPLDGEAKDFTLKTMRLYPQQIAQVNGDVALLENGRYAIENHGMGTGKTIVSASVAESYAVRKWLRSHPGKTLKDAYAEDGVITYRNIVMCPGHLVEKWASEVAREVPYAKTTILNDFDQLLEIRKRGIERKSKEWFFISKDFGKLSYQSEPTPKKRRYGRIKIKECLDCGESYYIPGHTCPSCGSRNYRLEDTDDYALGMVCPHCNQILIANKTQTPSDDKGPAVLDHYSFTNQNNSNSHCFYCENELWQPHVANLGDNGKKSTWVRATHYSNKAHKGTKTVWVHRKYMSSYFNDVVHEQPLNILENNKGSRKYSPVEFIKRYLRGFFDIAVFDEAHLYKGGTTGQGHAMHALIKASKKQLALTGTIAGGYANHLYYLLWRLEPQRMVKRGYLFTDELKFVEKYGKLEKTYEYSGGADDGNYNASCKGRQKSSPRVKPGISPMIFMDYLLDRTTFLDLTDMSKYLPALRENVVLVDHDEGPEELMLNSYNSVIDELKKASRDKMAGGKGILSTMLQFSLSYPDKPFGVSPIKSPRTGATICEPKNFNGFMDIDSKDNLLSKEKKLIEIVNSELAEGRNCFVYAEYTGSPETCITGRLQAVLEKYCDLEGKVAVLESSSPKACDREAWIHKMAAKGVKVFITNPKCTETGLDFCFKENGKTYNYPTIIFYQLGYSLFSIWQASRRHYRLNQTKECRTYYLAWAGTIQQTVISLIAEKQAATSAIQGRFSAEGLSAMANGTDARMKLAQSLSENDTTSVNELQEMFDVLADTSSADTTYDGYKPMQLFEEIVGTTVIDNNRTFDEIRMEEIDKMFAMDLFDLNNFMTVSQEASQESDGGGGNETEEDDVIEEVIENITSSRKIRSKKYKAVSGQMSFF